MQFKDICFGKIIAETERHSVKLNPQLSKGRKGENGGCKRTLQKFKTK